jgi:hypothetical protein
VVPFHLLLVVVLDKILHLFLLVALQIKLHMLGTLWLRIEDVGVNDR